jgi:hypothetical protein
MFTFLWGLGQKVAQSVGLIQPIFKAVVEPVYGVIESQNCRPAIDTVKNCGWFTCETIIREYNLCETVKKVQSLGEKIIGQAPTGEYEFTEDMPYIIGSVILTASAIGLGVAYYNYRYGRTSQPLAPVMIATDESEFNAPEPHSMEMEF